MTLFGRNFWTSNYVNEQPKKFPTCHVRNISIYAPTRGATPIRDDLRQVQAISIHAPTRGATILSLICFLLSLRFQSTLLQEERRITRGIFTDTMIFQSTLLQEERQVYTILCYNLVRISIHAPTRGATARRVQKTGRYTISIHAPTRGATVCRFIFCNMTKFQSTLLQEERHRRI